MFYVSRRLVGVAAGATGGPLAVAGSLRGILILGFHCQDRIVLFVSLSICLGLPIKALEIFLKVLLDRFKQLVLSDHSTDLFEDQIQLIGIKVLEVQRLDILADTLL